MKWFWRGLLLLGLMLIQVGGAIIAIRWHAMRQIEIEKLPQAGQEWCLIEPSFERLKGREMVLTMSFRVEAFSFYAISPDRSIDDGLYVMEDGEVSTSITLEPGWNTIYFSYGRANPKCWSLYSVKLWVPYFRYPWE